MAAGLVLAALALLALWFASDALWTDSGAAPENVVRVAAAANFAALAERLAGDFTRVTGTAVAVSSGSTGELHAQIVNGAPFHVFLAADGESVTRLVALGLAPAESRFTYASGHLVLAGSALVPGVDGAEMLRRGDFRHLAIANPRTAPYGAAAQQALAALGLWQALEPRLVRGENVAQTYHFVRSGAAELGLVALSQVIDAGNGRYWQVPQHLYGPLEQQAVLLAPGREHAGARAFLAYLETAEVRRLIAAGGYDTQP